MQGPNESADKCRFLLINLHKYASNFVSFKPDCVYESRIELKPQPERQHLQIWLGDMEYVGLEAKGIDELKISTKQKCP